jgi:hypothetical protein
VITLEKFKLQRKIKECEDLKHKITELENEISWQAACFEDYMEEN